MLSRVSDRVPATQGGHRIAIDAVDAELSAG
jgi:hypothetical protein